MRWGLVRSALTCLGRLPRNPDSAPFAGCLHGHNGHFGVNCMGPRLVAKKITKSAASSWHSAPGAYGQHQADQTSTAPPLRYHALRGPIGHVPLAGAQVGLQSSRVHDAPQRSQTPGTLLWEPSGQSPRARQVPPPTQIAPPLVSKLVMVRLPGPIVDTSTPVHPSPILHLTCFVCVCRVR